jgi:hypothetical protein
MLGKNDAVQIEFLSASSMCISMGIISGIVPVLMAGF